MKPIAFPQIESLSGQEKAYIAGLIDGEGCFSILAAGQTKTLVPVLSISMCHRETIAWVAAHVGARVSRHYRKAVAPNWRPQWVTRVTCRRGIALSAAIAPYLITKRDQAGIFAEYAQLGWHNGNHEMISLEDQERLKQKRLALKQKIQGLNRPTITRTQQEA